MRLPVREELIAYVVSARTGYPANDQSGNTRIICAIRKGIS